MTSATMTSPLSVPQAIAERRATKAFQTTPLPDKALEELIRLTLAAPSSFNLQDWSIVLVQEPAQKAALSAAAWGQKQIIDAPVTFVFIADPNTVWDGSFDAVIAQAEANGAWPHKFGEFLKQNAPPFQEALKQARKLREYAVKDAIIGATHLMLTAQSLGFNTCPMNGWDEAGVKTALGITNPDLAIALVVPVGYAAAEPKDPGRRSASERVHQDRFGTPYGA